MAAGDTALWLHNKLGSTDDLWSGKTICSQLSQERLQNIHACFHTLQPHVKVKLMLSFLHIPRRNVDLCKGQLEEILMLAIHDTDQWVSMVGEILRTYPATGALNLELEDNNGTFAEVLSDLKKMVKRSVDVKMLPMECQFLNKTALIATTGQQPLPTKHFALKRKPKSAALRAELLQKSSEAAVNRKRNGSDYVPIKVRSFAKKMDDFTPLKGFPSKNMPTGGFLSPNSVGRKSGFLGSSGSSIAGTPNRMNTLKKEGGIKLLDIAEQPLGPKEAKRRRKLAETEAIEQAKEKREAEKAAAAANQAANPAPYTPDYAAGLVSPAPAKIIGVGTSSAVSSLPQTQTVSYVPTQTTRIPEPSPASSVSANTQQARDNLQQQLQQLGQSQIRTTTVLPSIGQTFQQTAVNQNTTTPIGQPLQPIQPQPQNNVPQPLAAQQQQQQQQPQAKKGLSLTREQMVEAQEMFKNSNKVTRPEKALILGFMAGSRENPCPQQGNILSIRLSEAKEHVTLPDQNQKQMLVDTFFQMNYLTGEWKRVKKYREIEEG
ncbi:negative elongation factor A-like [Mercenaria mercenaria]|uniref:negative elongation factor A-like n=1 Tax=Mercenaria mercenaria TaxID=6596 RepID=UPI00234EDE5D|nr:negative elongation factor A-like [Mercenaria mercenaria]